MLNIRKFLTALGLVPVASTGIDSKGEMEVLNTGGKLNYHNGTTASPMVTEAHTATLTNKTIDADSNTITNIENADIKAAAAIDATKIANGSVSSTEFQYLDGVTSAIQTQLDAKASKTLTSAHILVGNVSNVATDVAVSGDMTLDNAGNMQIASGVIVNADVNASAAIAYSKLNLTGNIVNADINASAAIDASKIADGTVSSAEFQYINSLTSNAQTQLDAKASSASLTAHTGASTGVHGVTGAVVGTTDTQVLTGKTIDGDDNTVQDLALTSLKTNVTDASKFLVRNGSGVVVSNTKAVPSGVVVGDTDSQILTNKTLTSPTVNTPTSDVINFDDQGSTPSNPSSGFYKLYFKTDGVLYKLNSSGTETAIGVFGLASSSPTAIKTADYTVLTTDDGKTVPVDSVSNPVSITLPAASTANFKVIIKDATGNAASNNIKVFPSGSDLIDGSNGYDTISTAYNSIAYHSDGTSKWFRVVGVSGLTTPTSLARGVDALGFTTASVNTIEYLIIASTSNTTNFGTLSTNRNLLSACSSTTRGVFGGGYNNNTTLTNLMEYITIATAGNATTFGNLTVSRATEAACGSATRGVFGGGYNDIVEQNVMDYITIATTGNATTFGNLTSARRTLGALSSSTRGVFGGGVTSGGITNIIDYITIASTGNATSFGNLTLSRRNIAGCSSATRGIWVGGNTSGVASGANNTIDYITIASTGNATDFGDLTAAKDFGTTASSSTRGVFMGGSNTSGNTVANIDYVTIASTGNATNFGNLSTAAGYGAGLSSDHGGLQ